MPPSPSRLGPYEVLAPLGKGGRGPIHRARDPRSAREVAIKVLPAALAADPDRLSRFLREAQAAASLQHPNLLTVYDAGVHEETPYLAFEILQGVTLRRRLSKGAPPWREALAIARDIARGLVAAHEGGVVHRDLKPESVILLPDARAKILDLGLGTLAAPGRSGVESTANPPRTTGYRSPEQIAGEPGDHRDDIFALGVIFHELLTGKRAVAGDPQIPGAKATPEEGSAAPEGSAQEEDPPAELAQIVRRCIEKRGDDRFQSARDLMLKLEELSAAYPMPAPAPRPGRARRLAANRRAMAWAYAARAAAALLLVGLGTWAVSVLRPPSPDQHPLALPVSVAVLPFGGPGDGPTHLGRAVPSEIAALLTYAPGLTVRPFTDSSRYVDQPLDLAQVGRALGVRHLVVGNLQEERDALQISVEAIEVATNRVAWSDRWQGSASGLASLRATVRERVTLGLLPALGQRVDLPAGAWSGPVSEEAYGLFLRAATFAFEPGPNEEALQLLRQATALDPAFAPTWLELAHRHLAPGVPASSDPARHGEAVGALGRAIALDPHLVPAAVHHVKADTRLGRAAVAYRSASELLERRPDSARAHYARGYVLRYGGATTEAAKACRQARILDPTDSGLWSCYGTFLHLGDLDQADSFNALGRERHPDLAAVVTADIRIRRGDHAGARHVLDGISDPLEGAHLRRSCLQGSPPPGTSALVDRVLGRMATVPDPELRYWYGTVVALCGFEGAALKLLESSIDGGYCSFTALANDRAWDGIRHRPAFEALRERARACRNRFLAETGVSG